MENDEYQGDEDDQRDEAYEPAPREPGPKSPEEYRFDDWALI